MNNLQQVINQAQSDIAKGFVFVHIKTPDLKTLLEGLEESQRELEKVTLERDNENWRAIWYEGHIEDASRSADKWQQYYINLLEEHKAMKEALEMANKEVETLNKSKQKWVDTALKQHSATVQAVTLRTKHAAMKHAIFSDGIYKALRYYQKQGLCEGNEYAEIDKCFELIDDLECVEELPNEQN